MFKRANKDASDCQNYSNLNSNRFNLDLSNLHNGVTELCTGGSGDAGGNTSPSPEVEICSSRSSSEEKIVSVASPFFIHQSVPSSQLESSSIIVTEDTDQQHLNSS